MNDQTPVTERGAARTLTLEHRALATPWILGLGHCAFAVAILISATRFVPAGDPLKPPSQSAQAVELRGRVICLAEEMHRLHEVQLPTKHEHLWGFKSRDGTCYTLLRTKFSEGIFLDERVRQKELLLKAKLFPKTQVIEVTVIRSFRDGAVQDLYYYCDVCAIKSVSPEVCACCQAPVVLTEKPLSEGEE